MHDNDGRARRKQHAAQKPLEGEAVLLKAAPCSDHPAPSLAVRRALLREALLRELGSGWRAAVVIRMGPFGKVALIFESSRR